MQKEPDKKIKIAFYILVIGLSFLIVSAIALRVMVKYQPDQTANNSLYSVTYLIATISVYLSTAALFFIVYFLFKGKKKRK